MHPDARLSGTCLFLDLDIVITCRLDDFFTLPGRFYIIHNWIERRKQILRRRPLIGNSSVFRFVAGQERQVVEEYLQQRARANDPDVLPIEQVFMTQAVGLHNITWWPEKWVRSYKRHCLPVYPLNLFLSPKVPADCRILAFHGSPKPDEVIVGVNGYGQRKYSLPMPVLEGHWR